MLGGVIDVAPSIIARLFIVGSGTTYMYPGEKKTATKGDDEYNVEDYDDNDDVNAASVSATAAIIISSSSSSRSSIHK
ncbi:hypothetical protein DPMN_129374 [Dreissena polymorpha]|uniref:Uncharacterized protein n=1 Tax=Dreissena polymorpha TaxID=45954 RepID=A0A9D4K0G9_DREPO|nr:hypothetical protein DPMN_129374 [Dreissena polymorpha]